MPRLQQKRTDAAQRAVSPRKQARQYRDEALAEDLPLGPSDPLGKAPSDLLAGTEDLDVSDQWVSDLEATLAGKEMGRRGYSRGVEGTPGEIVRAGDPYTYEAVDGGFRVASVDLGQVQRDPEVARAALGAIIRDGDPGYDLLAEETGGSEVVPEPAPAPTPEPELPSESEVVPEPAPAPTPEQRSSAALDDPDADLSAGKALPSTPEHANSDLVAGKVPRYDRAEWARQKRLDHDLEAGIADSDLEAGKPPIPPKQPDLSAGKALPYRKGIDDYDLDSGSVTATPEVYDQFADQMEDEARDRHATAQAEFDASENSKWWADFERWRQEKRYPRGLTGAPLSFEAWANMEGYDRAYPDIWPIYQRFMSPQGAIYPLLANTGLEALTAIEDGSLMLKGRTTREQLSTVLGRLLRAGALNGPLDLEGVEILPDAGAPSGE